MMEVKKHAQIVEFKVGIQMDLLALQLLKRESKNDLLY